MSETLNFICCLGSSYEDLVSMEHPFAFITLMSTLTQSDITS